MTGKKKYIIIQRGTASTTCVGEDSWYDIMKIKGYIAKTNGNEEYVLDQYAAISSHVIRCDYIDGITTSDRIRVDGRLFDIVDVDNSSEYSVFTRFYVNEYSYES
jgi:SPP1 family predicted phage head-tail adaptor